MMTWSRDTIICVNKLYSNSRANKNCFHSSDTKDKRHFKIRHDLNVDACKVDGDPQQVVRCVLCDWVYDMRSKEKRWHKPNVLNHFLSHKHWDKLTATTNGGGQVVAGTIQHKEEICAADTLVPAVIDDAIYSCCSKSLPHTAMEASLDCTSRALFAVKGKHEITPKEIYAAAAYVSKPISEMLTRLKVLTAKKKPNRFESRSAIRSITLL